MSGCCKSHNLPVEKVGVEERIKKLLMRPGPGMHWFLRTLYVLVALFAVLGFSKHIFR